MNKKHLSGSILIKISILLTLVYAKNQIRLQKLNDCRQCQIFSDSFLYWFEKTAHGRFDGGDVAWEETNLKSYAQSEIRLVEIQENLCSEQILHVDECYSVAEESEILVEKWWSEGNLQTSNFFNWLCLENLKYCCPRHHYGENCTPCALDENGIICNNRGNCYGDGTRKGNGSCICHVGYSGQNCNECASNYFNTEEAECMPCHKSCHECYSYGSNKCQDCAIGWELLSDSCSDIDECQLEAACKKNQFCINNEGSFLCKYCDASCLTCIDSGPYKCTSCRPSEELWSGKCIDKKTVNKHFSNAEKRCLLYIFLNILTYLFYRKTKILAFVTCVLVSILIFKLETESDITVKDLIHSYITHFIQTYKNLNVKAM